MTFFLQPGELFEPVGNTIWRLLRRTESCSEPGCWNVAHYELERTLIAGTVAALDFRCINHVPYLIGGTGQSITIPPATGGVVKVLQPNPDAPLMSIAPAFGGFECAECWNTGYYHGFGIPCKLGCKPGKPVLPVPRIFLI